MNRNNKEAGDRYKPGKKELTHRTGSVTEEEDTIYESSGLHVGDFKHQKRR